MMRYTYDNSVGSTRNPNRPPRRVTFGQTTSSEMGDLWLQVLTSRGGDRAALDKDYAPNMLNEDIAGVEKALEVTPGDARLHALEINPNLPAALTDLAWILATADQTDLRAPNEAVRLAERAAQLTQYGDPTVLDTLAAAYFAAGSVDRAVSTARAAFEIAIVKSEPALAGRVRQRLEFYEQTRKP